MVVKVFVEYHHEALCHNDFATVELTSELTASEPYPMLPDGGSGIKTANGHLPVVIRQLGGNNGISPEHQRIVTPLLTWRMNHLILKHLSDYAGV